MSRVNSRNKGANGERQFAAHLRELGFQARRGQQHAGGPDSPDVVTSLDNIHFEVKFGYPKDVLDLGTKAMEEAIDQARREQPNGSRFFVVWKPRGTRRWRYTTEGDIQATYCFRDDQEESNFLNITNRSQNKD